MVYRLLTGAPDLGKTMIRILPPLAVSGAFGLALAFTPVSPVFDGAGVRLILNDALAQGGPPEEKPEKPEKEEKEEKEEKA